MRRREFVIGAAGLFTNSSSAIYSGLGEPTPEQKLVAFIEQKAREVQFEPSDDLTRQQMQGFVHSMLTQLVMQGSIQSFEVVCDRSNNPPRVFAEGTMCLDVNITYLPPLTEQLSFKLFPAQEREQVSTTEVQP